MKEQILEVLKSPVLLIATLILLAAFGYLGYDILVLDPRMEKEGKYTIGTAIDTYKPTKGPTVIRFNISVDGRPYSVTHPYDDSVAEGDRFLVKFLTDDPDVSRVLLRCKVEESTEAPDGGWEAPPFECDEKE